MLTRTQRRLLVVLGYLVFAAVGSVLIVRYVAPMPPTPTQNARTSTLFHAVEDGR